MKPMNSSDSTLAIMAAVSGLTEAQERTIAALPEDQRAEARAVCREARDNGGDFERAQKVVDHAKELGVPLDQIAVEQSVEQSSAQAEMSAAEIASCSLGATRSTVGGA